MLKGQERLKGEERILGDSDFMEQVLAHSKERYVRRQQLKSQGVDLERLSDNVATYFKVARERLSSPVRYPKVVQARSVLCFLAVRELKLTATELAGKMGLTQPAISISVKRGEGIVKEKGLAVDMFLS